MTLPDSLPLVLGLSTVAPSTPQADSETSSVFSDKDTASPLDPESSSVYFDSVRTLGSRAIYSEGGRDFSVGVIQVIQMIKVIQKAQKLQEIQLIQGEGWRLPFGSNTSNTNNKRDTNSKRKWNTSNTSNKSNTSNTSDTSITRRGMETSLWEGGRQARRTLRRTRAPAQFARRRPTTRWNTH